MGYGVGEGKGGKNEGKKREGDEIRKTWAWDEEKEDEVGSYKAEKEKKEGLSPD